MWLILQLRNHSQGLTVESGVLILEPRMHTNLESWRDGQKTQVEERVHVGSQEYAVLDTVRVGSFVRRYVGCLEDIDCLGTRYGTSPIRGDQLVAELLLSLASPNRP